MIMFIKDHMPIPFTKDAVSGESADSFARMVQSQVKSKSWTYIGAIKWSIFNREYLWDLQRGLVRLKWEKGRVLFDVKRQREVAYLEKKKLEGDNRQYVQILFVFAESVFFFKMQYHLS